jgi:hypothetical protein
MMLVAAAFVPRRPVDRAGKRLAKASKGVKASSQLARV